MPQLLNRSKAVTLFCSLLILSGCHKEKPKPVAAPVTVTVFEVEKRDIPAVFQAIGTAESSHLVDIRARVEGYLDVIAYQEGAMVDIGTLLFQIDPRPFQASLDSAKAELARQRAILWNATQTRKRMEPLYKLNAASQRDLDNAIAEELAAEASVEAANANVRQAQLNLDYTTITSPIVGITSAANYREGSLITSSLPKPLTTVSAIDPIWINFSLSEGEILRNRKNVSNKVMAFPKDLKFTVSLILADNSTYPYKGIVDFAEPAYNQQTGTISVRTTFPNPEAFLKPGQFVQVRVSGATYLDTIIIPQEALMQSNKGPFVYITGADDRAEMALVELGDWWQNYWIITSGLKVGDRVIVSGISKVQIGAPLQITGTVPQPELPTS